MLLIGIQFMPIGAWFEICGRATLKKCGSLKVKSVSQLFLRQDDPRKAMARFKAALHVDPDLIPAYMVLGSIHEGLEEYEKA